MNQDLPAAWTSRAVLGLIEGPPRQGTSMGRGYVAVGGYVLALVPSGLPRMPNGIACDLTPPAGEVVRVGAGCVASSRGMVRAGPAWEPVPSPEFLLTADPCFVPDPLLLAGRGAGLTPAGDDLLCGYVAGLVLWHGRDLEAAAIAAAAAVRTTSLAATLLRHAAAGELPEPAHALLQEGDPGPLRAFGHSSGRALMYGLALGCSAPGPHPMRVPERPSSASTR